VALAISSLIAMAILGVDISRMLVARVQLQNSADAGALAGARMFMDSPTPTDVQISAEATRIAGMNKAFADVGDEQIPPENIDVSVDMTEQRVRVTTRSLVSQYFLGVTNLGINAGDVDAVAVARVGEICNAKCLKPWSIPDRWDDMAFAGYSDWQNNGYFDKEEFNDLDESNYWNPGEPWEDVNNDGRYNQEFYHPIITGYMAAKHHGLQIELKASNDSKPVPGQYWPVDLPDENGDRDTGGKRYRWNIANCNPYSVKPGDFLWTETGNMDGPTSHGMRELYDRDRRAYWDEGCECVEGSEFSLSPRIGLVPIHDPRINIASGKKTLLITKIAAFFIEDIRSDDTVVGRFLKIQAPGEPCPPGETAGGFLWNLSLIR
jgi:hypothetical protein